MPATKNTVDSAVQEAIDLSKRRIALAPTFTPESSGLSANGQPLPINEAMPGGGMVIDDETLKAQAEPGDGELPVHPLSPDRPAIDAQREANRQVAQERQDESERLAALPEEEQPKSEQEDKGV